MISAPTESFFSFVFLSKVSKLNPNSCNKGITCLGLDQLITHLGLSSNPVHKSPCSSLYTYLEFGRFSQTHEFKEFNAFSNLV